MKKGALHVHTNLSDGAFAPEEVIAYYRDLGFGFVAITDHSYLVKPDYLDRIPDRVDGIMVFKGIELEVESMCYHHVLEIPGEKEMLRVLCHPDSYQLSVEDVNGRIKDAPFPIDAVEITYLGFYTPKYDTAGIALPKIATDDAHDEKAIARAWIEVDAKMNRDAIIRAVKAGDFVLGFR